jgi:hypothetical protein
MFRLTCILLLTTAFSLVALAQPAPSYDARNAKAAWEGLVKAKGGRERLHSLKSFVSEYSIVTRLDIFPGRMWEFKGPFYGNAYLLIFDTGKSNNTATLSTKLGAEVRDYSYDQVALERVVWLLETKFDKPEILSLRRERDGKITYDVVKARIGTFTLEFAFEPEEMLVRRVYFYNEKGSVWQIYAMDDYKLVDGVQMPQLWDENSIHDKNPKKFEYVPIKFNFNVDYDPTIFEDSTRPTTSDAWKPRPRVE